MSRPVALLAVACCLLPAVASNAQEWKESPFHREGFYAGIAGTYAFDQGLSNYLEDSFTELTDGWNAKRGVPCPPSCPFVPQHAPIKSNNVVNGSSVGINARVGYRIRPWIAGELQIEYVPPMRTEVALENKTRQGTFTQVVEVEVMSSTHEMVAGTANARIFFPTGRVQPYMLGGLGLVYSQTTGEYISHCVLESGCRRAKRVNPVDVGAGALEDGLDFGFRAGGGIDIYLNRHLVVNWEATAVLPMGKLDQLNYYSFVWGVQYRF